MDREVNKKSSRKNIKGGVFLILLLPLLLKASIPLNIRFSHTATDNLYGIKDFKEKGNITTLSPFIRLESIIDINYSGSFSIVNFNPDELFLQNYCNLQKDFDLPGFGNKNVASASLYNYLPVISLYKITNFYVKDSLRIYLGNNLLNINLGTKFKFFEGFNKKYWEPVIKTSLSLPIPYSYLTPEILIGAKIYENERIPLFGISGNLSFPLTPGFSFGLEGNLYVLSKPDTKYIVPDTLFYDPSFEKEAVCRKMTLEIYGKKLFTAQRSWLTFDVLLFREDFFEINNFVREDEGIVLNIEFEKMVNRNMVFSISGNSLLNSSNISEFQYTRNSLSAALEFLF